MAESEKDCLLCKVIRGEIPSYTVFEGNDVRVSLDTSQVTKGHTLIIPKKHLVNFFDYSQEDAVHLLQHIPVVAQAVKKSDLATKGLNVEVNNGETAGQVVMYSHIHLIPRRSGNDPIFIPHVNDVDQYSEADYQVAVNVIKNDL